MPPRATIIILTIICGLLIVAAAWAARTGRITGRASKMAIIAVVAAVGIILMLYPFLGLQETVGD